MFTPITADHLADVPLFDGFDEQDLEAIATRCIHVYVRKGIQLLKAGESGFQFFILLDGTAEVLVGGTKVGELGPGDVFGEMALLGGGTRAADVVATSHMTVATMMVWDFRAMTEEHPDVASRLRDLITSRS
jgi:CRP-like cAMP-binding protein